jgi:TolA-binding protein
MKKLITITLLGLTLIACQNNNSKKDQDAKIQELEEKIEQLSGTQKNEIEQQEKFNVEEKSESKEEFDKEKVETLKPKNEEKNSEIENLKAKYKHLRAKFVSTDEGDLFYYNFKDEKGKEYSFSYIKDESYELLIEDESSNFGQGINPKYKNKYFDIFYQVEKHDLLGWGEKEDYDVVIKMILAEQ